MRCPQCSAEQPGGVTVCGFCGAPMHSGGPLDGAGRSAARAKEATGHGRRRLWIIAASLVAGLALGWLLRSGGRDQAAGADDSREIDDTAPPSGVAGGESGAWEGIRAAPTGGTPAIQGSQGDRLTVERLEAFADEVATLAAEGRARELSARIDLRARYQLAMIDSGGRRELTGGRPELLAHWLAPWIAAERAGTMVDEGIELQNAAVASGAREGTFVRRLESDGDVTSVQFSADFLLPLATNGALAPRAMAALDLSPFNEASIHCVSTETVRVAVTPVGVRVTSVERIGVCEP